MKFQVLPEGTNVNASFQEHCVYSNFEMFSVLILGFLLWFVVTYPKGMCKSNSFFVSLGVPRKKKTILLLSWSTLHMTVSECIASWFHFSILISHYSPKMLLQNSFFLEILGAPWKKQCYCFFRGAPCISQVENV